MPGGNDSAAGLLDLGCEARLREDGSLGRRGRHTLAGAAQGLELGSRVGERRGLPGLGRARRRRWRWRGLLRRSRLAGILHGLAGELGWSLLTGVLQRSHGLSRVLRWRLYRVLRLHGCLGLRLGLVLAGALARGGGLLLGLSLAKFAAREGLVTRGVCGRRWLHVCARQALGAVLEVARARRVAGEGVRLDQRRRGSAASAFGREVTHPEWGGLGGARRIARRL